ncbi:hypothetical protein PPERSA_04971 [Pseudocohnilembus persalinus]|uniref:2-oxoacid dehydrogenase acyltransferase catalytic domain-containing protein n=1 Tax=Pseudocohnilembus persalinus TaxID=266149 RepID=A0A0V0QVX8_PSEPJ|nr:hypothetical protein PPERSA_04971 [Pseudocohnilembus persalinus]|eukprot:KRX06358.1 hypothetical protein PPERSA_04971 [Pseudocohnilembus persalinus]
MGLFQNAFFFAGTVYALFYERILVFYFLFFVGAFAVLYLITPSGKFNPLRRKIMFSTWEQSKDGNIHVRLEQDVTNLLKYQSTFKNEEKPSVTHVVSKALAMSLNSSRDTLNGKIVFDKFVPFENVSVTVLVDVKGMDLAAITIKDMDKLTIQDINQYIRNKGKKAKENKDEDHKKRTGPLKLLPPFIIRVLLKVTTWISFNLGLNLPPFGIKKDTFGAGCVTSIGSLGLKDAIVPFTPFMNCSVIVSVGQIEEKVIVKGGEIVKAPIINLNFTIDHRFIDGAKGKKILNEFIDVMENPEKY